MSGIDMNAPAWLSRRIGSVDYLKISIFGAGLALFWASLHSVILPQRVQGLVPDATKNAYLGLLTFSGLVVAMAVQPFAGALSDRITLPWGRRRPFILLGTLLGLAFLPGVSLATTYLFLLLTYCALQLSLNVAQAPFQAFIPDLVPPAKHGQASGVKSLAETASVLVLLQLVVRAPGQLNRTVFGLGVVIFLAMVATMLTVKERRPERRMHPSLPSTLAGAFSIDFRGQHNFLWFLLSRLLILMALGTLQTFAFFYLKDFVGVSAPATATTSFLVAVGAGMLASIYLAGWASDRLGRKPVLVFSGVAGMAAMGVLLVSRDYAGILASTAVLGVSAGSFVSTNWALATDLVPPGEEAAYMGLTNVATAGGGALSRLIGPVIDYLNSRSPGQGYTAMLLACLVYFAIGTLLTLRIKVNAKPVPATAFDAGPAR